MIEDRETPITLAPTRTRAAVADGLHAVGAPRRRRLTPRGVSAKLKLVHFFAALAIKEHLAPNLHVRPLVAELFLTENCNLECTSCACWRSSTRNELTTAEWEGVIDQCADLGLIKLNFTGGEPLLRRDAARLVAHARERGIGSRHLNTNAILLDRARRTELLEAGVNSFNISVDGPDATTHDSVRGIAGSFDRTVANLRALMDHQPAYRFDVRMNFTILRTNVSSLAEIARLAQELGVRLYLNLGTDTTFLFRDEAVTRVAGVDGGELRTALRELDRVARANRRGLPRFSDRAYIARHFDDLLQPGLPCAESQLKLMIHSTGGVGGCWGHDPSANVRERSLAEIVDDRAYRAEHARLFEKDCVGCGSNYSLNLRWRPRTYVDDVLWRLGARSVGGS